MHLYLYLYNIYVPLITPIPMAGVCGWALSKKRCHPLNISADEDPGRPFVAKEHDEFQERCKASISAGR